MTRIRLNIFLLLAFYSLRICSQSIPFVQEKSLSPEKKYSIQVWTTENGLPQNSINDIEQTNDGYLWMATYDGLVRFDGVKFKTFNTSNTATFKTNGIRKLFVDAAERLWLITVNGELLSYVRNEFTCCPLPEKLDFIRNIITGSGDSSILVVAGDNKLYRIKDKITQTIPAPLCKKIYSIQSNSSAIWAATDNGLWKFSGNTWTSHTLFGHTAISQLYSAPRQGIIVDAAYRLFRVDSSGCTPLRLPFPLKPLGEYEIAFNESEQLTILSPTGLHILSDTGFVSITTRDGLSFDGALTLFVDKEKNTWIGTSNGGLNRLKTKIFKTYAKEDGMLEDGTSAIIASKRGSILIGNNCGGINEYKNGAFLKKLRMPKDNRCVWSLMEDGSDRLWVGTYGGGVSLYENNVETRVFTKKDGLTENTIFALYTDRKKNTWVGTGDGLCKLEKDHFINADTSFHSKVTFITEDRAGRLWLCSDKGLAYLKNNRLVSIGRESGYKEGAVRYLYEDPQGIIWLGTHGNGLVRVKNDKAFYFCDHSAQLDKNVWSVVEDRSGNLWLPSNSGMFVVNKEELNAMAEGHSHTLNPLYLSKEDGLKNIEFNGGFQPSALETADGKIWFPTVKGIAIADPAMLTGSNYTPRIIIESIQVNDSVISCRDTLSKLNDMRTITISFTAPTFINSSRINFEYRIEGIDREWVAIGTSREVKLNSVPEGIHTLTIRIAGKEGSAAGIVINKPAPLWKRPAFIIASMVAFALVLLLIAISIIHSIRKREKTKTQLSLQYANIELRSLQTQLNPHFIFNCLNSIQHFILISDDVSASRYLGKFSSLMRMFLEHSKSNLVSVQQEAELLGLYVEIESLRFKNGFNFHLHIHDNVDPFNIQIPSMLFQPFVENAIKHGLLNREQKGTLLISFHTQDSCLIGTVEDDGVGRAKARALRPESDRVHASHGIQLITDRITAINYIENTTIELYIEDKANVSGEAAGTRVVIKIPI
ncbi:MAG: two-component regulator propeller domain-containing protein [Bacteroidia bacterium]